MDPVVNPILSNLVDSHTKFYGCFSKINGNYKEALVFENDAFSLNNQLIDREFFGIAFYNRFKNNILSLTFSSCFMGRRFKTQRNY